jgi:8-oxo-dGTP pyrophosphatase MutT (NUDIX family)
VPGPPDARGRSAVRRAGRARLRTRAALAEELRGALLAPDAALAIDVHGGTEAAVLAPLYIDEHGELHAVFTKRRDDLKRHAGEISFPGGRRDPEDADLTATALREAHEEIGLPPDAVEIVGALPPTPTFVTNYAVYPFVGLIEPGASFRPNPLEVAEVVELSLADLAAGFERKRLIRRGVPIKTPTYTAGGHLIWGATARIVGQLLERLQPLLAAGE